MKAVKTANPGISTKKAIGIVANEDPKAAAAIQGCVDGNEASVKSYYENNKEACHKKYGTVITWENKKSFWSKNGSNAATVKLGPEGCKKRGKASYETVSQKGTGLYKYHNDTSDKGKEKRKKAAVKRADTIGDKRLSEIAIKGQKARFGDDYEAKPKWSTEDDATILSIVDNPSNYRGQNYSGQRQGTVDWKQVMKSGLLDSIHTDVKLLKSQGMSLKRSRDRKRKREAASS